MYNNSNIFEECDFTINSQNINKLQDNISSEDSIQLSVSFQKENFQIHPRNDMWDDKKRAYELEYGLENARKSEKIKKEEANKKRIGQILEDKKDRRVSEIENGKASIKLL